MSTKTRKISDQDQVELSLVTQNEHRKINLALKPFMPKVSVHCYVSAPVRQPLRAISNLQPKLVWQKNTEWRTINSNTSVSDKNLLVFSTPGINGLNKSPYILLYTTVVEVTAKLR